MATQDQPTLSVLDEAEQRGAPRKCTQDPGERVGRGLRAHGGGGRCHHYGRPPLGGVEEEDQGQDAPQEDAERRVSEPQAPPCPLFIFRAFHQHGAILKLR